MRLAKAAFTTQRVPHQVKSETGSKIEMTLILQLIYHFH